MPPAMLPFAAGEAPAFLGEVAALVVGGALVAYLAFRLGLVPIVGFLLAGVLIGPNQLGIIGSRDMVSDAAEVGVILLLFTIGLEFSLERLARIGRIIFVGGGLQVILVTAATTGLLVATGVAPAAAIFTGLLVSLSSTAIVLKLLGDRSEMSARHGQVGLGLLLFQDLAVVLMVLVVPALGGEAGTPLDFAWALAKAAGIVAAVVLVARRLMPRLLELVARTCSPEVFLITVVAVCFGTAYGTSLAGVSVSLGAFLAGLLVSESRFDQQALGEVLPLQIVFSALFFVSVGMLLDVGFLLDHLPVVLGAVLALLVVKALTTGLAVRALGERPDVAVAAGLMLAQVGEFSFVLERVGRDAGLSPAGLGEDGAQGFIAATVLLMVATPWLTSLGVRLGRRVQAATAPPVRVAAGTEPAEGVADELSDHVVVAGYGAAARSLTAALQRGGVPLVVTTLSPDGEAEARRRGLPVLLGDATRQRTLQAAGLDRARYLVIADDEPATGARIASVARTVVPDVKVLVRTRYTADMGDLVAAGADYVISEQTEASARLAEKLMHAYDVAGDQIELHLTALRTPGPPHPRDGGEATGASRARRTVVDTEQVIDAALDPDACPHAASTRAVVPSARGCEDCLRAGGTWVHLRICLTCGHVGCCDSSPNRHARAHHEATEHHVVRSVEPGEDWSYCFADERMLVGRPAAVA
jgi:CPA2 family monovalent cation:H+ antiporter-2